MKKKIFSLVLVVAMLASMLVVAPVSGASEAPVTVETTDAVGVKGETVSVDVILTCATEIFGFQLGYEYDSTMLRLDSVTWGVSGGSGDYSNKLGDDFKVACAKGPFDVMIQTYATAFDVSDGLVVATLNFTALEDGTSKVAIRDFTDFADDSVNFVYTSQAYDVYFNGNEIACAEASTVNVCPEGYIAIASTPIEDFEFDADDATVVSTYLGEGGVVVIPEGALTVGSRFTYRAGITTLIVPAFVKMLDYQAIHRPSAGEELHVYVLGAETKADGAFSTSNSYGKIVVHAPAGSPAAEAADGLANVEFVPTELCSLTVGDASYLAPKGEITLPGVTTTDDGKIAVAWKKGDTTYAPGAAITVDGDLALEPVTITAPAMNAGAGLKVADKIENCKMRFTTNMAIADYEALASLGTVTMGTIITPAKYVSLAGGLTKEALNDLSAANGGVQTYIDVVANGYFEKTETTYTFAGSLAGFKAQNINLEYAAAFYATVTLADGSSFTVYTDFDYNANRSVGATIDAAVTAGSMTDTIANGLKALIAANKED